MGFDLQTCTISHIIFHKYTYSRNNCRYVCEKVNVNECEYFFFIVKGFDSFYGSNLYLYKVKVYNLLFLCSF